MPYILNTPPGVTGGHSGYGFELVDPSKFHFLNSVEPEANIQNKSKIDNGHFYCPIVCEGGKLLKKCNTLKMFKHLKSHNFVTEIYVGVLNHVTLWLHHFTHLSIDIIKMMNK